MFDELKRMNSSWIPFAVLLVSIELGGAFLIGWQYGFQYNLAISAHIFLGLTVTVCVWLSWSLFLLGRNAYTGAERALDGIFTRAHLAHGLLIAVGILLVALQMCALQWTKSMIPYVTEMWADPPLAALDRIIFRTDPWTITHAVLGQAPLIDFLYILWSPLKFGTLILLFCLPVDRGRILMPYFLIGFISVCFQYALPSGGPIFYERLGHGSDFSALPIPHFATVAADYLWEHYRGSGIVGTGISAMPSVHVAMALWMAFAWGSVHRWLAWLGGAFFVVIFVGSIHTGFHYASDAVAGTIIALFSWVAFGSWRRQEFPAIRFSRA